jgi:DNA polymerase III subunit beta
MKFIVSSSDLLSHLQSVSKAISVKSSVPILDHFLFDLNNGVLTITASDLESTLITKLEPENIEGEGSIALEAKRLLDILKEFPEQPLTFEIDSETLATDILSENGKFSVVGAPADEFPKQAELDETDTTKVALPADLLDEAISKTLFATANDELRPVMNGIFFDLNTESVTIVASDSHKLVKYRRTDIKADKESSFILPKKPASLLRNVLARETENVGIEFDAKNAVFTLSGYKLICRLTEGKYPNYDSVIPTDNPNKLILSRNDFYNIVKRVSVFSNQASNLVKLKLDGNLLTISAQDIDFSISAYERMNCQYDGDELEIGFKSVFLTDILSNMDSDQVVFELADASRAGILLPFESDDENVEEVMLLMPMMI